ncbi:hypothetical protein ABES02_18100 [Neobacillus pocheonensis]|uniref:hypothetical protein n=1 Tax=Neobacillus pocheonensis TaxID=363869 RepID=UPI003D2A9D20
METVVFLIIIGILSTIFGRNKGKKLPPKNKPLSLNTFEELKKIFQNVTDSQHPQLRKPSVQTKIESQPSTRKQDLEKKYLQIKQDSETVQNGFTSPVNSSIQKLDKHKDPISSTSSDYEVLVSEAPDANTLINGIIWSEILGEPRSRKPYFPRKRQVESE